MPSAAQTNVLAEGVDFEAPPASRGTAGGPDSSNPFRSVTDAAEVGQPVFQPFQPMSKTAVDPAGSEVFDPHTVRALNRAITQRELLPQRRQIAERRAFLFRKRLDGQLTRREGAELRYLEWQLDRIEDAEIGEELDRLSAIANAHERLSDKVKTWLEEIKKMTPRPSKHEGGKGRRKPSR